MIVIYGIGFGSVDPNIPPGQLVEESNTLAADFTISFGGVQATSVAYDGLAPSYMGLYQFNVVVPNVAAGDAVPLTFTLGGVSGTQALYCHRKLNIFAFDDTHTITFASARPWAPTFRSAEYPATCAQDSSRHMGSPH
jgi:hypothetical protein